jgi:cyanoexosortase A
VKTVAITAHDPEITEPVPSPSRLTSEPGQPARGRVRMLAFCGLALVLGHLVLVLQHQTAAQLGITLICWYAVAALALRSWRQLDLSSGVPASIVGLLLLGLTVGGSIWMAKAYEKILFLYPLSGAVGLGLLASGFRGLWQYWRELIILFFLGIPRGFISEWIDLSPMTAKVAAFLLWYLGRNVQLVDTEIVLPGGSVNVDKGCDGTGVISYLLCLAVVFVFLFRIVGSRRVLALGAAAILAFITNMIRVLALALMEAAGRHEAFEYWHAGSGSIVWTVLPVILFGVVGLMLLRKGGPTANERE